MSQYFLRFLLGSFLSLFFLDLQAAHIELPYQSPTGAMVAKMEALAQKLPPVSDPGKMKNFADYLKTIDLIMLASQETPNCRAFIEQHILKNIPQLNSILDVGTGSGENTRFIAKNFKHVTLVDPEKKALDSLSLVDLNQCTKLTKIKSRFQDAIIDNKNNNLIVFAHVFYEIPHEEWIPVIHKAYGLLAPGGTIFIVFNQGGSRGELLEYFRKTKSKFSFDLFERKLKELFPQTKIFISQEIIKTKSLNAMLQLCNLFLFDAKIIADKKKLISYVEKNFYKNPSYRATMDQVFIKIKKPTLQKKT